MATRKMYVIQAGKKSEYAGMYVSAKNHIGYAECLSKALLYDCFYDAKGDCIEPGEKPVAVSVDVKLWKAKK